MQKIIQTILSKDIPADMKEKAIAEIKVIAIAGVLAMETQFLDSERIDASFYWRKTPSGGKFWAEIDDAPFLKEGEK